MLTNRYAGTGALFPFNVSGGTACACTAAPQSCTVSVPMNISPTPAAACRRAAVFTTSPMTRAPPAGDCATTTASPESSPQRTRSTNPRSRSSPTFSSTSASTMSRAARTARSASSSWEVPAPKTAIASPMNFSTTP